jgi:hypothetical protein
MTRGEAAKLATAARQRRAAERAAILRDAVSVGAMVKQAAHIAGVSRRTSSRYMRAVR